MTYIFEPNNGTRYTITALPSPSKTDYYMFMLDYWQTFMYVREGDVPHWTYIKEKLGVSQGDAIQQTTQSYRICNPNTGGRNVQV